MTSDICRVGAWLCSFVLASRQPRRCPAVNPISVFAEYSTELNLEFKPTNIFFQLSGLN